MPDGKDWKEQWYAQKRRREGEERDPYEIRAAYDYLGRLQAYLQSLIATDPGFTKAMAASIWQDVYTELFPEAEWKERDPTDEELRAGAAYGRKIGEWIRPAPKPIHKAALWGKVQSYFTGLEDDVRVKEELDIAQYAETQSRLITQISALPLGRGGTPAEQMWTAEGAIRNLRLQQQEIALQAQDNPYLASTARLIGQQVEQLRDAQIKLRGQAKTEARIRTSQMEERERAPIQRPMSGMPSAQDIYDPHLAGMPANMRRFYEQRAGRVYTEFERAFPGARTAWWQELQRRPEQVEPSPQQAAGIEAFVAQYGRSPFEMPAGGEGTVAGAAAIGLGAGEELPRPQARDPWEAWLADYQFAAKYIEQPRQVRGFYPRRSVGRARWFT